MIPDRHSPDSEDNVVLTPRELLRILKPLTLLRVNGTVTVKTDVIGVSRIIKKAITDTAHPVPNIYNMRACIIEKIKRAPEIQYRYWRPALEIYVQECDVANVQRMQDGTMDPEEVWDFISSR